MKSQYVIVDFVRTPLCPEKGAIKNQKVEELAARTLEAIITRTAIDPNAVEQVIFGHAHMDTFPYNVARYGWLLARFPESVPCYSVHMCGASGLHALQKGYYLANSGNDLISVVGGAESYSNAPYILRRARYGIDLHKNPMTDSMEEGELNTQPQPLDPRTLADQLAREKGYTREAMDSYIAQDVKSASGDLWRKNITPIIWNDRKKGEMKIESDTLLNPSVGEPAAPGAAVTNQNFGRYADGAAAMLAMAQEQAQALGKTPLARVCAIASAAGNPKNRWEPAVQAVLKLFEKNNVSPADVDALEIIADSAASMMAISGGLSQSQAGLDAKCFNQNGSCLARGINEGGDGIIAVGTNILTLQQKGGRYGVVTAAASGGQGMAVLIERL